MSLILTVNLITTLLTRFKLTFQNIGLLLSHSGILIILLGGAVNHLLAVESQMPIYEGASKNFSEDSERVELVIIQKDAPIGDTVYSIPETLLRRGGIIEDDRLPFRVHVRSYLKNARLETKRGNFKLFGLPQADRGIGLQIQVYPEREVHRDDQMNVVTAFVEFLDGQASLGTWLLSRALGAPQKITTQKGEFEIYIRAKRYYNDYTLTLKDFKHDIYAGTNIPRNYSSDLHLSDPIKGEERDVLIYMNHPLRYRGKTYYQASFGEGDTLSVLQVVENPGWLLPYISCSMIAAGLLIHFLKLLIQFSRKKRT